MRFYSAHIVIALCLCGSYPLIAQDLETIKDQKVLEYSGGISATTTAYNAWGIPDRRDPFFWQLQANLNFTILGIIQAPFSMTVSQQNKNFSQPQPFNRFGLSPRYKGLTVHLGYRTMNFSSYTLAGNMFLGIGAEYVPENSPLRASVVYGRFTKPVTKFAQEGVSFALPAFRRMGYGGKIGYEKNNQQIHLIFFTANDQVSSVPQYDTLGITPEENVVIGIESSFRIFERVTWSTEYAYSMYSTNAASQEIVIDEYSFVNNLGGLFKPTLSSRYTNAFSTAISYQAQAFSVNGKYRRVDPEYVTLGSSFLNNDLEDISAGLSVPILQQTVTLAGNAGMQRNNLDDQLTAQQTRFIFSASASWVAGEALQVMANYGNYNSSTSQVQLQTNILEDSLEYFQVTHNGSMNVNYALGKGDQPLQISWLGSVQDATDSEDNASTFISNTLSFQKPIGEWSISLAGTANQNKTAQFESLTAGPLATLSRSFEKGKYRISFTSGRLLTYTDKELDSSITNFRLNTSMRAGEKHNISLSGFYTSKKVQTESEQPDVQELRASVTYNFRIF